MSSAGLYSESEGETVLFRAGQSFYVSKFDHEFQY